MRRTLATVAMVAAMALLLQVAGATSDFGITNVAWGTAGSTAVPAAGQHSVPLTITMDNLMCSPIKTVQLTLSTLGTGFSLSNGASSASQTVATVSAGSSFSYTFYLSVPQNITQGVYYMSGRISYYYPTTINNNCTASSSVAYNEHTDEYYSIPVYFDGNATLSYRQLQLLDPGEINNVSLLVTNVGTGNATQVQATVSPSGRASVISQPRTVGLVGPNETGYVNFTLYVPNNASGSVVPVWVNSTYVSGGGSIHRQDTLFPMSISSRPALLVVQNQTVAGVGATTQLSIGIRNNGDTPIYDVQASMGQSSKTLNLNSTNSFSVTKGNPAYFGTIGPNQTVWFTPSVTTSPSIDEGGYNTVLSVDYTTKSGSSQSFSYNMGIIIAPRVSIAMQGVSVSSLGFNSSSVQVSGNLLDIGSGNAYYVSVYASLVDANGTSIASNSTYVGQVLSDSPTAFSLSLFPELRHEASQNASQRAQQAPQAQQGMQVRLYAVYYDNLGDQFRSNTSTIGATPSGSFLSSGSGAFVTGSGTQGTYRITRGADYTAYVVIGIIIVVIAASVYLYRRRRRRASKKKERRVT